MIFVLFQPYVNKWRSILWDDFDKSGRHDEEDDHPWCCCDGNIVLLYVFRLFDGKLSQMYVTRLLPDDLQSDSGGGPTKRKREEGYPPSKNSKGNKKLPLSQHE